MQADVLLGRLVELRHQRRGEPDGLLFEHDLDAVVPVFGLVKQDPGLGDRHRRRALIFHFRVPSIILISSSVSPDTVDQGIDLLVGGLYLPLDEVLVVVGQYAEREAGVPGIATDLEGRPGIVPDVHGRFLGFHNEFPGTADSEGIIDKLVAPRIRIGSSWITSL